MLDRTGPRGHGPRTGRGRGYCPPYGFGQEGATSKPIAQIERPPTSAELALWSRAENAKRRTVLYALIARLLYQQVITASKVATKYNIDIGQSSLAATETRMVSAISEIEKIRQDHCDVNGLKLGVSPTAAGDDLNIVQPPSMTFGAIWIPIAIGAVVVAGIIARWAYLENEVQEISDHYNGVLRRADQALCADPSSPMCADWQSTKQSGGYQKNETLLDSVKSAVGTVGGWAGKGIGIGIAIAIPLLMMMYLPRRKAN